MSSQSDPELLMKGVVGSFGFIANSILLWILFGFWLERNQRSSSKKYRSIQYLSLFTIFAGSLFCFSQAFFMQNSIIPLNQTRIECEIVFRFTYVWMTIQRFSIYLFCFMRLKCAFESTHIVSFANKYYFRFMIFMIILLVLTTLSWCICFGVKPVRATLYTRCDPFIYGGENGIAILVPITIMLIDFIFAMTTSIYFGFKLCQLRSLTVNQETGNDGDSQLTKTAVRVLISGFLAIFSSAVFMTFAAVSPFLGNFLPIDSVINSIAILISFDVKCKLLCKRYICWPWYQSAMKNALRDEQTLANIQNTDKTDEDGKQSKSKLELEIDTQCSAMSDIPSFQLGTSSVQSDTISDQSPVSPVTTVKTNDTTILSIEGNNNQRMSVIIH